MADSAYDRLRDRLHAVTGFAGQERGHQLKARCPAHEDRDPSLSVTRIDGQVLVYCHAGCDTADVLGALDLSLSDLYDEQRGATYRYDGGRIVHRSPNKRFRQSGDTSTVELYHLSLLHGAGPGVVYLVEGEKDVHAIEAAGGVATTAPMGASNFDKVDVEPLRGRHVAVIVDQDDAGTKWAAEVARKLDGVASGVRHFRARTGKDAADHVAAGHGLEDFEPVDAPAGPPRPALEFLTVKELRARVAVAGPRRFLLRGLWPGGDYGVHAGDMKAQKTMNTVDVAVSVASGTPWLGLIPVDQAGPVLMFAGEGGEADLLRRIDAVAASRDLVADDLPITVCCRAPHLSDVAHLGLMADELDRIRPSLTTVDPLYLAARGAKLGDLYAMGALLEAPQHLCQEAGTSLWVATHQNRKEGRGASRITGAGPAEWGRVLISATVVSRHRDAFTGETVVISELDVIGGSIPGGQLRLVRRIRADNPDDLDSPLRYHVEATHHDEHDQSDGEEAMPPARRKLLEALKAAEGGMRTSAQLIDWIAQEHGHGLKRETVSRELNALYRAGLTDRVDHGVGHAAEWFHTGQEANP